MYTPLVTVGLPTFNRADYLKEAIQSVLDQSLTDFELIVSDNASSVDVEPVVGEFNDPRISFVRHPENLGAVRNMNSILERANGRFVELLHDDDVMMPDNLKRKVAMLEEHPSAGFVHSSYLLTDADGNPTQESPNASTNKEGLEPGRELLGRLLKHNPIGFATVMFRKSVFADVGGFHVEIKHCADISMWIKISLFHDAAYINAPLIHVREHEHQDSTRFLNGYRSAEQIYTATVVPLNEFAHRRPELTGMARQFRRDYLRRIIRDAAKLSQSGNLKTVTGYLGFAIKTNPTFALHPTSHGALLRSLFRSALNRTKSRSAA